MDTMVKGDEAMAAAMRLAEANGKRRAAAEVLAEVNGWQVCIDDTLGLMCCYVDAQGRRTYLSGETWDTLLADESGDAVAAFYSDHLEGASGMRYFEVRDVSASPYAKAARARAEAEQAKLPIAKSELTALMEQAQALLVQAAGLNKAPTDLQRSIFSQRYAELQDQLAAIETRVTEIRDVADLAGIALADL